MPGGAHQRRVIRGRRAVCSQSKLIIVIVLMSKLRTSRIGRTNPRNEPAGRAQADPVRLLHARLATRPTPGCLVLHHRTARLPVASPTAPSGQGSQVPLYRPLGWQPNCFLLDRAEAERALALAEQLGSINAAAEELGTTWRRCAKPSTATASACLPPTTSRSPAGHRRLPPAHRQATYSRFGPGLHGPNPGAQPTRPTITAPALIGSGQKMARLLLKYSASLRRRTWTGKRASMPLYRPQPAHRPACAYPGPGCWVDGGLWEVLLMRRAVTIPYR